MSSNRHIPDLLEHVICLPPETSLLVLTGIINASQHWLVTRFLSRLLSRGPRPQTAQDEDGGSRNDGNDAESGIVLVSWMRDHAFWHNEAKRGVGIDLNQLESAGRFAFVDGLTNLFVSDMPDPSASSPKPIASPGPERRPLPSRGAIPSRGPAVSQVTAGSSPVSQPPPKPAERHASTHRLASPSLQTALRSITEAIDKLKGRNKHVFLILDSPTLLLTTRPDITVHDLNRMIMSLRSQVHSTLLSLEADSPLIAAAAPSAFTRTADYTSSGAGSNGSISHNPTPLEARHAAFVAGAAHQARWIMSVRGLDTGAAKDVSGVLTVRKGGAYEADVLEDTAAASSGAQIKDMEVLYKVAMDGSVKVFERGSGDIG